MTRARGSHFFRSADVTFYEIRRWRDREREREGGDFVTSNEERAVLSKLIIGRHWRGAVSFGLLQKICCSEF